VGGSLSHARRNWGFIALVLSLADQIRPVKHFRDDFEYPFQVSDFAKEISKENDKIKIGRTR